MSGAVKVDGTYRNVSDAWVKVAGTWRRADTLSVKVAGTWRQGFSSGRLSAWTARANFVSGYGGSAYATDGTYLYVMGGSDAGGTNVTAYYRADLAGVISGTWGFTYDYGLSGRYGRAAWWNGALWNYGGFPLSRTNSSVSGFLTQWNQADFTNHYVGYARAAHGMAVLGSDLYAFGGVGPGTDFSNFPVYDTVVKFGGTVGAVTVTTVAPMPAPRSRFGYAVLNDRIYVIGGNYLGDNDTVNTVFSYDGDTWRIEPPLPVALGHSPVAVVVGNRIYVTGGRVAGQPSSKATYSFDGSGWRTETPMLTTGTEQGFGANLGGGLVYGGGFNVNAAGAAVASNAVVTGAIVT